MSGARLERCICNAITVIIPSRGRPEVLHDTLASLSAQTRPAHRIIVAVPEVGTDVAPATRRLPLPLLVEQAPVGTSAQRNHAIRCLGDDAEFVVFLDDDVELDRQYLEAIERFFRARPQAALMTGEVLAHGVRTGGVARADARRIVASEAARRASATTRWWQVEAVERAYGCNMALPRALLDRVSQFDENMPLYGWMEDLEFSYRCARHGPILLCRDARMVHLGHASGGRRSGAGFGFSEIMNPFYLWRKGGLPRFKIVLGFWLRAFKNVLLSLRGPDRAYRRARLRGNLVAFRMILAGRIDPAHVLELEVSTRLAPLHSTALPPRRSAAALRRD